MTAFVSADITVDDSQLLNDGLDQINALLEAAGMPGWTAEDPDLAVILLSTIAQIAADEATTAATVLPAIFRAFGTQLLNLPYQNGTTAMVDSTWTFTSPAPMGGYTITSGTAVVIDGSAFYVSEEVDVASGASTAAVVLIASATGTSFNGLGGVGAGYPGVQLNDEIDWVAGITVASVTSGGTDQEDDDEYQDRLAAALRLQAPRPITASDFAGMVLSDIAEAATGVAVGRSTALDGYYPIARALSTGGTGPVPLTLSGSLTSGSPTVTVVTAPYPYSIADIGASVTGTAIPGSTTVLATPAPTTSSFTLSANATANETAEVITVTSWTNVERAVTIFVTDIDGNALTDAAMDALETWLDSYREAAFLVFVEPPSYNTIYVDATVHALPGYDPSTVASSVQAAVISYLSPATWGGSTTQGGNTGQWLNSGSGYATVRFNSLIGVIENVTGVQYVTNGGLTLGFSASPSGVADLQMTGPAPLPESTTSTILVTTV